MLLFSIDCRKSSRLSIIFATCHLFSIIQLILIKKNKQVMNMMIQLKMLSCCPCLPGLGLPMIKTCLQSPILLFAIRETDGNDDDDDGGGFHLSHERRDHVTNLVKKIGEMQFFFSNIALFFSDFFFLKNVK